MNTDFFKCYGATERHDELVRINAREYLLIFGYGHNEENDSGYTMRKYYDHEPTTAELKADIDALVNAQTDDSILNGFEWNGIRVWLSTENQFNFKAAYDMAVQSGGASLPVTFKLGENASGEPIYHTFSQLDDFTDFITRAMSHVIAALNEGWREKDSIDYISLITAND